MNHKYMEIAWVLYRRIKRTLLDPKLFLLWVIAPLALVMLIITPPFQAPDEHTHFFKAVQLSEGKVVGKYLGVRPGYPLPVAGDQLPAKYKITADHYVSLRVHTDEKVDRKQVKADLTHSSTKENKIPTAFENTVVYPPLAYIPQAIIIAVTNLFDKNVLVQLYMARLAVLVVAILLLYFAVKRTPIGKWAIIILAATPMSVLLMGSCSGDAITIGLSALFIANVLAVVMKSEVVNRRDIVTLIMLAVALGLCKSPYQLLILFIFAIPISKYRSKAAYYKVIAAAVAAPLILAAIWALLVNKLYLNIVINSNNSDQLHFILGHPVSFVHTFLRTYFGIAGDYVPRSFIDLSVGPAAPLPLWFVMLNILLIAITVMSEKFSKTVIERMKYIRILAAILALAIFATINTLLYITFTPVRETFIDGMQGRYLIPISFLLIPALGGVLPVDKRNYEKLTVVLRWFIAVGILMTYLVLIERYY